MQFRATSRAPGKPRAGLAQVDAGELRTALDHLRALPSEATPAEVWASFPRERWPGLLRLLDLAAGLPRLAGNDTLAHLPAGQWPELDELTGDLLRLQGLVDAPVLPPGSREVTPFFRETLAEAATELADRHCATLEDLFGAASGAEIERQVEALAGERAGTWGALERGAAPALWQTLEEALAGDAFRRLTGFDLGRGELSVTLSLQDLDPAGIGWHRDLYWPREWLGRDVFAVFYALGDDAPAKGGAFVYYVPWENRLFHFYRRRGQATVLWNSADHEGRLLHAVTGYHGADTSRHLLILQCLRHQGG